MTKEQEEAIEYFKKHIKYFEEQIKFIEATDCDYYDEELELYKNRVEQFKTVLSMLEEQDKKIKELKQSKIRQLERYKKYKENIDNQHEKIYEGIVEETEFKDKIISLMVEKFADIDFDDMCLDCECCVGNGCVKEERDLYENCIKQYFENKAKELLNK